MAWSWSHTDEAYATAERNLRALSKETLEIIFAEWRAAQDRHGVVDEQLLANRKYARALEHAKTLPADVLADFIWEKASAQATCDNGGFAAWMCPYGCGPHCVSFSDPGESDESVDTDVLDLDPTTVADPIERALLVFTQWHIDDDADEAAEYARRLLAHLAECGLTVVLAAGADGAHKFKKGPE